MRLSRFDFFFPFVILLASIISVFDLFINKGRPATMDGLVHVSTVAMYSQAMREGDTLVRWIDGFGNYGFPLGIIAHQLPIYLGSVINLIIKDPVVSLNIIGFLGILLSSLFFYLFLRIYFKPEASFLGTFLFNFAPYRIINLYIRGAAPEIFASIFLPLILIGINLFLIKKNIYGLFLVIISFAGLSLTHPMSLVIYSFVFVPYALFVFYQKSDFSLKKIITKDSLLLMGFLGGAGLLSLGIAGYYLLPLNLEIKYLYFGLSKNHLTLDQYMGFKNYLDPRWFYFTAQEIFSRGHVMKSGLLEISIVAAGVIFIGLRWIRRRKIAISILEFATFTSILIVYFTSIYSNFFYTHINILSNIQFPWRMFSAFIFLPPIIFAFIINKLDRKYLILVPVLLIAVIRFPQLYGKNYTAYSLNTYQFTAQNLHSTSMNTIWSGVTEDYPVKKEKPEILEGEGRIIDKDIKNSYRKYTIQADTPLKMVDYTFYFPGWNLYIDGNKAPIEFQDPAQRGVITYQVLPGEHTIDLKFEDTKVRRVGKVVSVFSVIMLSVLFLFRHKIPIKK